MFAGSPLQDRRRAERVVIRIPIVLFGLTKDNRHVSEEAATSVVSRTGALVRSRTAFKPGSSAELTNGFSKQTEKCRIVWVSDHAKEGLFDLGLEILSASAEFWGISFPSHPK